MGQRLAAEDRDPPEGLQEDQVRQAGVADLELVLQRQPTPVAGGPALNAGPIAQETAGDLLRAAARGPRDGAAERVYGLPSRGPGMLSGTAPGLAIHTAVVAVVVDAPLGKSTESVTVTISRATAGRRWLCLDQFVDGDIASRNRCGVVRQQRGGKH